MTVNIGVEAFKIEAKPLARRVWPDTIKTNGIALLSSPISARDAKCDTVLLDDRPVRGADSHRSAAASVTRAATIVRGGNSFTATPTKKNEPPQSNESSNSRPHSLDVIGRCWAADI